jgi:hypothetical protein
MSAQPKQIMTQAEAETCIAAIKSSVSDTRAQLLDLYERDGWRVLGYGSWRECALAEFEHDVSYLYRLLDAALIERSLSPIGDTGWLPETHARVLKLVAEENRAEVYEAAKSSTPDGLVTAERIKEVALERSLRRLREEDIPPPKSRGRGSSRETYSQTFETLAKLDTSRIALAFLIALPHIPLSTEIREAVDLAANSTDVKGDTERYWSSRASVAA